MSKNKSLFLIDSPNIEQDSFQVHSKIASTLYDIITKHSVSKTLLRLDFLENGVLENHLS